MTVVALQRLLHKLLDSGQVTNKTRVHYGIYRCPLTTASVLSPGRTIGERARGVIKPKFLNLS